MALYTLYKNIPIDYKILLVKVFRIVLSTARCLPRKMVSYK